MENVYEMTQKIKVLARLHAREVRDNACFCTSYELSVMCNKDHKNILRDIDDVFEELKTKIAETSFGLVREIKLTELRFGPVRKNKCIRGEE